MLQDGTYGELPEAIREPVRRIQTSNQEMANLVDGLAAIVRLEDGADALRLPRHHLGKLVADAVAAVETERAAKQIRIEQSVSSPDPEVEVDAERLHIAIVNLLTNAIKYSPEQSTITIVTRQGAREATIAVSDQGLASSQPGQPLCSRSGTARREWRRLALG